MSDDDAVAVIGHERGVDIARWLEPEALSRIAGYVSQLAGRPAGVRPVPATRLASRQPVIEIAGLDVGKIPGITPAHAQEAQVMAKKVFPVLYVFENSARDVITRVLKKAFGKDWWGHVPLEQRNQAEFNKKKEGDEAWHSKRAAPIQFIDLPQLKRIVADPSLWPYFKPIFPRPSWFESVVDDINVSRRVAAHMNPLSEDDIKSMETGFRKWVKQLQAKEAEIPA